METPNGGNAENRGSAQNFDSSRQADGNTPEGSAYFNQALKLSARAVEAGALTEALMWAQQAELIGQTFDDNGDLQGTSAAYSRIMLEACLRSQELAIVSGHLTREHGELAEVITQTSDRLAERMKNINVQPRPVALMAQGYAKQHKLRLTENLNRAPGPQNAPKLEDMLQTLALIERCATILCGPEAPKLPFDRRVSAAKTAASNARGSLSSVLSTRFSNWAMAEFFCRNAFLFLTKHDITELPIETGNAVVDKASKTLPAAYDALQRRSYEESLKHLDEVIRTLNNNGVK